MIRIVAPLISAAAIASQAVAAPLPRAQPGTVAARQWDQAPSWEQAPPPSWDGSSPPSHEWTPPPAPEHQQPAEWQEPPKEEHVPPPPAEWHEPPKEEHIPPPPAHEPPKEEHIPPPVEHETYTPPVEHETYTPPVEHESVYESWPPAHETTYPPSHETTATYESWPETYTPPSYPPPEGWHEGQPVPEGWYTSEASWYKYEDVPHTTTGWYPPAHPTPYPSPPEGWKEGQPAPEGWYTSEGSWYKYEDVPHTTTGWYPPAHPTPYPSPPEGWKEGHPAPEGWYTSEGSWYKYETTPPAAPHETGVPPPSGATHTVYVSPEGYKGYVPFAVNAPVGDTIEFVWKQGPHTVSKSTINNICSRIEDDTFFTSGRQEAGATFHKVVNDTAPVWLYDNVDENCETGFWGVINPPANGGSNSTIADKLKEWTETYPDLKQQWEYIKEYAKEDPKYESALKWGDDIDVGQWEEKYYKDAAEKVMETRYWAIINEGVLESGKRKDGAEIEWPDFKAAVASAPPSTEQTPEEQAQIEADNLSQEEGASSGFAVRPTHAVAGLAMLFAAFLF